MWTYNHTDELYHYGVKGMKWGQRRAQKRAARDRAAYDRAMGLKSLSDMYSKQNKPGVDNWTRAKAAAKAAKAKSASDKILKKLGKEKVAMFKAERRKELEAQAKKWMEDFKKREAVWDSPGFEL